MKSGWLGTAYVLGLLMPGFATAEPEAVDVEFLEFLGSWDAVDGEWLDLMEVAQARVLEEESGEQVKADIEAESDD